VLEYELISAFYGDRCARRSGAPYMNHIDEGLVVLERIGASQTARRAFCLHPMVQGDEDLAHTWPRVGSLGVPPRVWVVALEYRNVANAYLASRAVSSVEEVALSPVTDVNQMLVADKVQNYCDFLRYHADSHPRASELDAYFRIWLARLGISDDAFTEHRRALSQRASRRESL